MVGRLSFASSSQCRLLVPAIVYEQFRLPLRLPASSLAGLPVCLHVQMYLNWKWKGFIIEFDPSNGTKLTT
jgi:hypothetical protein